MPKKFAFENGLTLIELMIVIILIGIGAALAAPNFSNIIRDTRLTTQANNLLSSLQLARSEAVSRGVRVTIRSKSGNDGVWDQGWEVFTDWEEDSGYGEIPNSNRNISDCSVEKDCLLRIVDELSASSALRSCDKYASSVAFLPTGLPANTCDKVDEPSFVLRDPKGEAQARCVNVSKTGRPYVEKEEDSKQCP